MAAGTASRLANDEMLAVRSYLNDGGCLFFKHWQVRRVPKRLWVRIPARERTPAAIQTTMVRMAVRRSPMISCNTIWAPMPITMRLVRPRMASCMMSSRRRSFHILELVIWPAPARTMRITAHRSSQPAASCLLPPTHSSRAFPSANITGQVVHLHLIRARSMHTRRSAMWPQTPDPHDRPERPDLRQFVVLISYDTEQDWDFVFVGCPYRRTEQLDHVA